MHSRDDVLSAHYTLLRSSEAVKTIIDELCDRDPRFQVIQESLADFRIKDNKESLLNNFLELISHQETVDPGPEVWEKIWGDHQWASQTLNDIVFAAIYEILDAFDIDISVDQVPSCPDFDDYVKLLENLHAVSRNRPMISVSPPRYNQRSDKSQTPHTYQYTNSLTYGKIVRVLHILPGSGRERIECHLEERDLYHGIDEALSYVWGTGHDSKCIWIDDQPFQITRNLHEILLSLRLQSTPRTLWIDAICINQSDLDEKSHQVRLMGKIYSNAKMVSIWLSGHTPELNHAPDPYQLLAPLPSNFGGVGVNQFDIVSIIEWTEELLLKDSFEREHYVALVLVAHWLNIVMSFQWWERVWTIQEAVLPDNHPNMTFGGYNFSFGHIIHAMNTMRRLSSKQPEDPLACINEQKGTLTPENEYLIRALKTQCLHYMRLNYTRLLPYLRPGHDHSQVQSLASPMRRNLQFALCATSNYRATDPRDKYFALQALLLDSRAKLMYTNYNESTEAVFKRATARCYNSSPLLQMTTTFDLFVESSQATRSNNSIPSWVHDFTYSDAGHHTSDHGDEVTFRGYMRDERTWNPAYNPEIGICRCFATPKTLFCSGLSLDVVLTTDLVPASIDDREKLPRFLTSVISQRGQSYWYKTAYKACQNGWDATTTTPQHDVEKDISLSASLEDDTVPCIAEQDSTEQRQSSVDGHHDTIVQSFPLADVWNLFTLGGGQSIETEFRPTKEPRSVERQIYRRLNGLTGKPFFTTERGLIGISTAPVREGDVLAVMDASPAYYIFREVKSSCGRSFLVPRHQIVARAVVSEGKDKMRKRFVGLEHRMFQIV